MTEVSAMFSFILRGPGPAIMLDAYLVGNALCWLLRKWFHLASGFYVVAAIFGMVKVFLLSKAFDCLGFYHKPLFFVVI